MVVLTIILAFVRLRQEDCKFEGSLANTVRACLNRQIDKCSSLDDREGLKEKSLVGKSLSLPP